MLTGAKRKGSVSKTLRHRWRNDVTLAQEFRGDETKKRRAGSTDGYHVPSVCHCVETNWFRLSDKKQLNDPLHAKNHARENKQNIG